jgi:hypothetical protein
MAIDRLYMVTPQLHNQRVELKTSKVEEMEKARRAGTRQKSAVSEGKQRERDVEELEGILDLIEASDRKMTDQSVILDGGMKARLEKVRQRDIAKVNFHLSRLYLLLTCPTARCVRRATGESFGCRSTAFPRCRPTTCQSQRLRHAYDPPRIPARIDG